MDEMIFKEKILLVEKYFEMINDPHAEIVLPIKPEKFLNFKYILETKASREKKLLMCYFCNDVDHDFSQEFTFDNNYESFPHLTYFWLYFKIFGVDEKITKLDNHKIYLNDSVVPALNRDVSQDEKYTIEKIDDLFFVDGNEMDILNILNLELTKEQFGFLFDEFWKIVYE